MAARDQEPQRFADQPHLPPQDVEAEEALLGAMLMSPKAADVAEAEGVDASMFYRPGHRLVFEAIQQLRSTTGRCDELSVIHQLRATDGGKHRNDRGEVESVTALSVVGGASAVMTLAERCPAVANARAYAEAVVEAATSRRLVEVGHAVAQAGYDPTMRPDDAVRFAEQQLLGVVTQAGEKHRRGFAVDTDASMDAWSQQYRRYHDDQELLERDTLSWGRPELDERLGRMRPGQLFVPAGWTKHGKTWFVLDVAEAVMAQGARVLIDSGEMSDAELVERWIAMGGHDYTGVQEARIPWSVMLDRVEAMRSWRRRVLTGRMSLERLRSQVSRAKLEGDPFRLVVVDHLGLVRPAPGTGRHGRTEFLEDAVAELKAMAEEYGFTLLLVCQLSRPPYEKDAHPRFLRPPIQSDLKGASGIEQIATSVVFVYRRMVKDTGRFDGQSSVLLFPFHRSRQTPQPLPCEFVLPSMRPTGVSGSAYRFEPVKIEAREPSPAVSAVQEKLEDTFGPLTLVRDDDDIPF